MNIGKIGVWTSYRPFGVDRAAEAARRVEQLGYGAFWLGGSPKIADVRPILEATSTVVAATGILNIWSNAPGEAAAADAALRQGFPGRFMLGIGVGHPEATSDYRRPLTTMRAFLDGLDASPTPPPADERCLAALGPKMLELAADRTAGSHLYFVPVEQTRVARARLGADKVVAPELACVVDSDATRAQAVAPTTHGCTSACATTRSGCSTSGSATPTSPTAAPTGSSTRSFPTAAPNGSPRSSTPTSTLEPTTSACSRSARTASP
jgi:probable F420-dependent oxidoreductase